MTETAYQPPRGLTSLRSCALVLLGTLSALTAVAVTANGYRLGAGGAQAALIAGAIVAMGMLAALWIASFARANRQALQFGLASQIVRLGVPLASAIALEGAFPSLARAGLFVCVLGIYLPALLVETVLSVRMIGGPAGEAKHG